MSGAVSLALIATLLSTTSCFRGPGRGLGLFDAAIITAAIVTSVPPPPPKEVVVRAERPGHAWQPGYWTRDGYGWAWIEGRWIALPPNYRWAPSHWEPAPDGTWHLVPGHWVPVPPAGSTEPAQAGSQGGLR